MARILVTGGTGYIGSHTIVELVKNGYEVVGIDNFSRSYPWIKDRLFEIMGAKVEFEKVELKDRKQTLDFFKNQKPFDGIIHFAAFKTVPESFNNPLLYFDNNIASLVNILEAVKENNIKNFVFSSSCSIYGNPELLPVTESTPMGIPESPYARTKQMGEQILHDFQRVNDMKMSLLRYFNPVGSHESGLLGDLPIGVPDNLVPYITQTAIGKREELTIFGNDYETRDGTCVRDYIHVVDIANAHVKSLQQLQNDHDPKRCDIYNLGSGDGVTVQEVINAFEKGTGLSLNYKIGARRHGDVESIYADNQLVTNKLGWSPALSLEEMMRSAWSWEQNLAKNNWL